MFFVGLVGLFDLLVFDFNFVCWVVRVFGSGFVLGCILFLVWVILLGGLTLFWFCVGLLVAFGGLLLRFCF